MGTRGLIKIIDAENNLKASQYMQYDSYPSGQGSGVLEFLQDADKVKKLEEALNRVRFLDIEGVDKEFVENFDNTPHDKRLPEDIAWFEKFISRDVGSDLMDNIINSEGEVKLSESDSKWCMYAYTIDFAKRLFISEAIYKNQHLSSYSLDALPDTITYISENENSQE